MTKRHKLFRQIESRFEELATWEGLGREDRRCYRAALRKLKHSYSVNDAAGVADAIDKALRALLNDKPKGRPPSGKK